MNINFFNKAYVDDAREEYAEIMIKEYKEKIVKEEEILRKKKIISDIFVEIMSEQPRRKNGEWIISGAISRNKQRNSYGNLVVSNQDRMDFEYASEFLNECGINNRISLQDDDYIILYFDLSLQERDELEQYMKDKNQEKVLRRVEI